MIINYGMKIPQYVGPTSVIAQPGFRLRNVSIAEIIPATGQSIGGTLVTINGDGLLDTTAVTFDGISATNISIISNIQLTCVTPAHSIGSVDVVITRYDTGDVATFTDGFLYRYLADNQDLTQAASGVNYDNHGTLYEGYIDDSFVGIGRTIMLHLPPSIVEDKTIAVRNNPSQYNSFFGSSARPSTGGKNRGVIVTTRDIPYTAHVRHIPELLDDDTGAGHVSHEHIQTTTVYESLDDLNKCLSVTIDSKRYEQAMKPRVVGFDGLKYIIQIWKRVHKKEINS